ncbi:hypothetical protein [Muribaculum intestinale]|uniref:hypothetical protein n=1 Tax=Muribaculum intestinale TaxID=1796646 RepID=UPI0025B54993|nr:hypothetical protein [Muribaculum intestinale]
MSCFLEEKDGSLNAVLGFKRDQLLYDIKNYAYIEGSVMDTESNHNRHMVQDVGEEGNVDRVTRVLNLTVAKCRELLYPYTKNELHRTELNDTLREPKVYGIVLSVPTDFSQTTLYLLENLIHEYLVCKAVSDWLSITNPAKAQVWEAKAEDAESEIRANLHARIARTRRRLRPF